jgi:hypothetical protein
MLMRHMKMTLLLLVSGMALMAIAGLAAAGEIPQENFEWLPDDKVSDGDGNEYAKRMLIDGKTGETYLLYLRYEIDADPYMRVNTVNLARFDEETLGFEYVLEYTYVPTVRDYMVHDGDLIMLSYGSTSKNFTIAVNDPDDTHLIDFQRVTGYVSWTHYDLVAITDTEIVVLAGLVERGTSYTDQYMTFDLVIIDRETYEHTSRYLMGPSQQHGFHMDHNVLDDRLTIIWSNYGSDQFRAYWFSYDLVTGSSKGPTMFEELDWGYIYYPIRTVFGSDGSVHLSFVDPGPLLRYYDADMNFVRMMDLTDLIPPPSYVPYSSIPMMVNESGHVYVVHYTRLTTDIRVLIIAGDYSEHLRCNVTTGDFVPSSLHGMFDAQDRLMLVWSVAENDMARLAFTLQIPPTPDLEVDPGTFLFKDFHEHGNEHLEFSVRNIGRADATRYNVTVTCSPAGDGETLILIGGEEIIDGLLMDSSHGHMFKTDLPGGVYLVRITISSTGPLEIWTDNNVFEAWINVRNKAPVLKVYWPHDGQFVDDTLYYEGYTSDREDPDTVMTFIGLPDGDNDGMKTGSGNWSLTHDVSNVPSGCYGITISAFDGDLFTSVSLMIRIDHPEETLTVASVRPDTNVSLIVGEGQSFGFEAKDLFTRPIEYLWTLDDQEVAGDVTSFAYIASTAGEYILRAEADNTHFTVYHEWTISVREPIAPSILRVEPEGDLEIMKGASVDFSVSVDNPDSRTFTVHWTMDGFPSGTGDPLAMTMAFPNSGPHLVKATLVSTEGISSTEWTVNVNNRAPVITASVPQEIDIDIIQQTDVTFRIDAEDPDGDDLTYAWSSTGLDLRDLAGPEGTVGLPCDDGEPYTVSVTVSDGEDEATWEWTVIPDPPEPPVNHAPVLTSAHPSDDPIVIYKDTSIGYSVEATDEDGDVLTYVWGSSELSLDDRNECAYLVDSPCDEDGQYTVWVIVSDGQDTVRAEWTVKTRPSEEPPDMQNGHLPIGLIIALVTAVSMAAVAYIYWKRTKRGEE